MFIILFIFLSNYPPGDHLNNSVVHMRDQRNEKKGCFFEAERDSRERRTTIRGQNVPIFEKKGPL